jgi:HAD superfamily hydrolase (TIGR01509 family)
MTTPAESPGGPRYDAAAGPSTAGSSLSAVLFDMDGLLVNTEPVWLQAEIATMAELGSSWSGDDQRAILGGSLQQAARYFRDRSGSGLPEAQIAELLVDTMLRELRGARIPLQPGAGELLTEVAASGTPFALVSASVRPIVTLVLTALLEAGLPPFPLTIAGDEVARSKPDPLPYLTAADRLGIDIGRAVVLEDSANGVRSAVSAGATVVAVPHTVPIQPAERVVVRESLAGLRLADLEDLARRHSSKEG